MSLRRNLLCVWAIAINWPRVALGAEPTPNADHWDCGTVALYHLLRLEGRSVDPDRLREALGASGPEAHSFRQLISAGRRFGLTLDAVVLPKQRPSIDGPTLIFLKSGPEGHFVVVRPIGHTGLLWQVIDGERIPAVADAQRLFRSQSWTGLALVPRRKNYLLLFAVGVVFCCAIALAIVAWYRRRRRIGLPVLVAGGMY
jgi:ABC-type bacteriocin/lantibiotic exporter with double-glycine peptidase domain